ncbi:MAG TPA: thioredoxin family protein [Chitinophagales bacterium]|nr:thioredoxin family protein [Chitinophagales bacterium]
MKKILLVSLLIVGACAVEAQELVWTNNIDKAMEISQKTKKPLMLFFTGSDWCGWCKRLQNEVFTKPEFVTWAKDNVVLVEIDFPRRTPLTPELQAQNNQLQQFFAVQGYPTVWFVTASKKDGKINFEKLGSTGYLAGGPNAWLEAANRILQNK